MTPTSTHNNNTYTSIKSFISINDLKELEFNEEELETNQRLALKNFDRFRISELNSQTSENKFHNKYMQLQVLANLTPYEEFLKEEYFL